MPSEYAFRMGTSACGESKSGLWPDFLMPSVAEGGEGARMDCFTIITCVFRDMVIIFTLLFRGMESP